MNACGLFKHFKKLLLVLIGFAASMVAIAGIQGYRFLKTQTWAADWFKDETHSLGFAPVQSGGCLLSYTIRF